MISALGELMLHPDIPDEWWISDAVPVAFLGAKPLNFVITVPLLEGGGFASDVQNAIASFLLLTDADRLSTTDMVYKNYQDFLEATDMDELSIRKPEDIWKFVTPQEIYVSRRHRRDGDVYIQLVCECEWELEHGLQFVYRGGNKLVRVSEQDGHLTEADAFDLPEPEVQ